MNPVIAEFWPKRLVMGQGALDRLARNRRRVRRPARARDLRPDGRQRRFVGTGQGCARRAFLRCLPGRFRARAIANVGKLVAAVRSLGADILVSVGGGSAIDAGKGTALLHATGGALEPYAIRYVAGGGMVRRQLATATIPHIAIPTTAGSASEVMPTAGIRDVERRHKMLFWDDALVPQAVDSRSCDGERQTGPALTAASGMTAVARCIEALYSRHRNPLSDGLALHALRLLRRQLPRTVAQPGDLDARFQCQVACSMSGVATINAMASIVHALGHVVGGRYALQHGVSHTILLAPAMRRFMPLLGERQQLVLEALGGTTTGSADAAGAAAGERIDELVAQLPLQRRLRDIGIPLEELRLLAERRTHDYMMANLPLAMSAADIEALLQRGVVMAAPLSLRLAAWVAALEWQDVPPRQRQLAAASPARHGRACCSARATARRQRSCASAPCRAGKAGGRAWSAAPPGPRRMGRARQRRHCAQPRL